MKASINIFKHNGKTKVHVKGLDLLVMKLIIKEGLKFNKKKWFGNKVLQSLLKKK